MYKIILILGIVILVLSCSNANSIYNKFERLNPEYTCVRESFQKIAKEHSGLVFKKHIIAVHSKTIYGQTSCNLIWVTKRGLNIVTAIQYQGRSHPPSVEIKNYLKHFATDYTSKESTQKREQIENYELSYGIFELHENDVKIMPWEENDSRFGEEKVFEPEEFSKYMSEITKEILKNGEPLNLN